MPHRRLVPLALTGHHNCPRTGPAEARRTRFEHRVNSAQPGCVRPPARCSGTRVPRTGCRHYRGSFSPSWSLRARNARTCRPSPQARVQADSRSARSRLYILPVIIRLKVTGPSRRYCGRWTFHLSFRDHDDVLLQAAGLVVQSFKRHARHNRPIADDRTTRAPAPTLEPVADR